MDLKCFTLETPVAPHISSIFKLQFLRDTSSPQHSPFIRYLIKSLNKNPDRAPAEIPLDPKMAKVNSFALDCMSLYLSSLAFGIDVNMNTLVNAPSVT